MDEQNGAEVTMEQEVKPVVPEQKPTEQELEPTEPKQEPTESKQEPTESKQEPTEPEQEPTEPKQESTEPKQEPTALKHEPKDPEQVPKDDEQKPAESESMEVDQKPEQKSEINEQNLLECQETEQKPVVAEKNPEKTDQKGTDELTELEKKIIRQLEYYFGDMNLPRDKFLQQEIKDDAEGWVTFLTMTKFNRLACLSTDHAELASAMRKSTSGLLEISDDGLKLRRNPDHKIPEFNKERREEMKACSGYVKGFPLTSTLDEIQEFLEKAGKTGYIQMRKDKDKGFKGSCFVVYNDAASLEKFLEMDELAKFGDEEITRMLKEDYFKMKNDERKQEKQEELEKKQEQREQYVKNREDRDKQTLSDKITYGAVLHLSKIPENTTREDLKAVFEDDGKVCWAEFNKGDVEGKLRFEGENSAKEALEKHKTAHEEKVTVGGSELECRILEGDEELEYWKFVTQQRDKNNSNRNRRGGSWGGRSNQFGGRGRKRWSQGGDDQPHKKKSRNEYD